MDLGFSETAVRLAAFIGVFAVMASLEMRAPRRPRRFGRERRWPTNLGIVVLDSLFVRLVFPIVAVGAAIDAEARNVGLFALTELPRWLEGLIAVVVLDLAIYAQHVVFHKVPVLWRLHLVHHADPDFDVSTALRFHPIEIGLSMVFKIVLVYALGAPVLAVFIFEVVLNAMAMFNHANVFLPLKLDGVLRRLVVTPDMHRVHHSTIPVETDSNYGFNLSLWDRLFGTYRAAPRGGHAEMAIGLLDYPGTAPTRLDWALLVPFRLKTGRAPAPQRVGGPPKRR